MTKQNIIYSCTNCGAQYPKWQGRCAECGGWGTVVQETERLRDKEIKEVPVARLVSFDQVKGDGLTRISTGIAEFDRVLGGSSASSGQGGIVPGSLTLLGGDPGIGKSTLILQLACNVADKGKAVYVSGEESKEQVKMRLDRLKLPSDKLKFLSEVDCDVVIKTLSENKPRVVIIDSIQTMMSQDVPSEAGSVTQVRAATTKLLELAKKKNIAIFIIGHVTKEGAVAGPRTLEHLVDCVLYLEGDRYQSFRILRGAKNRFGATHEIGVFEMTNKGMEEVANPSPAFLEDRGEAASGSIICAVIEGARPFLIEIQALVTKTVFGYPQRKVSGFDFNRLQLLAAVLTKRVKLPLGSHDIHVNVVGGVRVTEPAADLAVCLAIISAIKNKALPPDLVAFGEVGLGGEVRRVNNVDRRLTEAVKLGFKKIIGAQTKGVKAPAGVKLMPVKNIAEAMKTFL